MTSVLDSSSVVYCGGWPRLVHKAKPDSGIIELMNAGGYVALYEREDIQYDSEAKIWWVEAKPLMFRAPNGKEKLTERGSKLLEEYERK